MLGMHGTVYANYAVDQADLLIALGVRFDDRVTGKVSGGAGGQARACVVVAGRCGREGGGCGGRRLVWLMSRRRRDGAR